MANIRSLLPKAKCLLKQTTNLTDDKPELVTRGLLHSTEFVTHEFPQLGISRHRLIQ